MALPEPNFGPTGKAVFERTYSRAKPNGQMETWEDTVNRVVDGNLGLVAEKYHERGEREALFDLFYNFKALPAGRHLWMSGIPGRQFLMNCWVAGWTENIADHYGFLFDQLMQGGGVGANYSNQYLAQYGTVKNRPRVHIVCDPEHPDYAEMTDYRKNGDPYPLISKAYSHEWAGAKRVEDSREGWRDALVTVLEAFWQGPDGQEIVLDLSNIRRKGSKIRTFGGTAAGPAPLAQVLVNTASLLRHRVGEAISSIDAMLIDHFIAECVVAGNVRRSARMAIKHWADPDIFDFITCKEDYQYHWSTNISVEVDDEFFKALRRKDDHVLEVYHAVVKGMVTNGEPGFYNRTLAQTGELGEVASTNPCGEQCLEAWEYCCLGHVNLDSYWDDLKGADEAHRLMTRFLIRATFADITNERAREVGQRNRRIGVGHFGYQGFVVKQGIRYSDSYRSPVVRKTLRKFYDVVRKEAATYAFQLRIPEPVKVTTIAPTGSIAKLPGVAEGIHPIYAKHFIRRVRYSTVDEGQRRVLEAFIADGHDVTEDIYSQNTMVVEFITKDILVKEIEDMGLDADYLVESVDQIELADMLGVQAMYQQEYADNAVSFTVNIAPGAYTVDEVKNTLIHYLPHLKGTTIMVDGSRPQAPYERLTPQEYQVLLGRHEESVTDSIDETCTTGACPIR